MKLFNFGSTSNTKEFDAPRDKPSTAKEFYKSLFDHHPDIVFSLDLEGNIIEANESFTTILGYTFEEIEGSSERFLPEDQLSKVIEFYNKAVQGESQNFELLAFHKNGQLVELNVTEIPIIIEDKVVGIYRILKDITEQNKNKRLIQERKQLYKSLFDQNPDSVAYFDMNGNFVDCNPALGKTLGYSKDELIKSGFNHLIGENSLEKTWHHFSKALNGHAQTYEIVAQQRDGHLIDMNITNVPIVVDNKIIGVYTIAKDITARKQAETALIEAESKYRSLVEKSLVGVYIIQDNIFIYSNPRLNEMLAYKETVIGTNVWDILHPEDKRKVQENIKKITNEHEGIDHQFRAIKQNGSIIDMEVHSTRIIYQGEPAVIGMALDITERKRYEERNAFLAYHDSLTGLPNRRMFEEKLGQSLIIAKTCQQKLAVMYLDMDRFKYINDSLGHRTGDRLLKLIAERLQQCLQESDLIARMGGDEFTILLPNINGVDGTVKVAKNIIKKLEEPFFIDEYELYVTTSVGISIYPNDGDDSETLMKNADSALYRAKDLGKNTYQIFTPSMNVQTYKIFTLDKDIRKALQQNELELYYQPKVNTVSGKIVGAEALIRWNHPEWGVVSPSEFIPLAEEAGLIVTISKWVKQIVCTQNKKWQKLGLPSIPISINISANHFLYKDIVSTVRTILHETGLEPHLLEIEITEDSLLENEEVVISALDELKEIGVKIALDDFGTGYSSLSYLKRFKQRIDTLKIDRSFIRDLHEDSEDSAIINTIIQLAQHMNMSVIAEGVETEEQLQILKHLKCEQIQGYLFSKPVTANDFEKLLQKGKLKPIENGLPHTSIENHRKYFRINLQFPLSATMTIARINGRSVELGKTEVLIEDLGIGGLRFLSKLRLGVHPDAILEIETEVLGETLKVYGSIVWVIELDTGIFQYGLEYTNQLKEDASMVRLLNQFAIQLRKSPLLPDCSFIKMNKYNYLKAQSLEADR